MALTIKNEQVESLVAEIARIVGESKTEALGKALQERHDRLQMLLRNEIWPRLPAEQKGLRLSKEEEQAIVGYN